MKIQAVANKYFTVTSVGWVLYGHTKSQCVCMHKCVHVCVYVRMFIFIYIPNKLSYLLDSINNKCNSVRVRPLQDIVQH